MSRKPQKLGIKTVSWLMLLLAIVLLCPLRASAVTENYTGTVGNSENFWFFLDYDDLVQSAAIENGEVPGMNLSFPNPSAVCLIGTPTTAGNYTLYVSVETQSAGRIEYTLHITIQMPEIEQPPKEEPPTDGTPKITKNPTAEKVVEGESAVFIARADHVRQYCWEIGIGDGRIDCADLPKYLGGGISVSGADSEKLVLSHIPKSLDGAFVWCRFVGAEESVYSEAAKITVIAQKDATPIVTKDPTDETVEEGEEAVFVAKAKYAQSYSWQLISPEGKTYGCEDAQKTFAGLTVTGANSERITLSNIPAELDGYQIVCKFTAGSVVSSKAAKLTVTALPETTPPTQTPTVPPTVPPTEPAPTEAPVTAAATEPAPTEAAQQDTPPQKGSQGLVIVCVICASVVAVSAIAAFVLLKLKGSKKQ